MGKNLQESSSFYRMIKAHGKRALVDSFMIRRPSVSERMAWGKALRKQTPRATHATYERRKNRPDPIEMLGRQNASRVRSLVPVRYGRMLANPFAFLRGAAAIRASDLSKSPVSGTRIGACA